MADTLSKLFGSQARVKLLRLFLFNPSTTYSTAEAGLRARVPTREVALELTNFTEIKLLTKTTRGRVSRYILNSGFSHLAALQNLVLNASAHADTIYNRIKRIGTIKLVVASGIFVSDWEGRVDLLIVGDKIDEQRLDKHMKIIESEVGKEVRYTLLTTQEFFYRLNMNDHLLRDVLDYTHRIMFDRLDIGLK